MGTVPWAAVRVTVAAPSDGPIAVGTSAGALLPWSLEMGVPSFLLGLTGLNSLCLPSIIEVALFFPKWQSGIQKSSEDLSSGHQQPLISGKPLTNVRNC